jgi:hypothetical protein
MSKSIAAMHVAKKQLGLDDDTYRATLAQVTGKASSADMTESERQTVLEHFRQSGFKGTATGSRKALEGKFAGKLQALWIAGWNLGLVRDRDDRALLSFVKRQTGLDHVRFLRHGADATKAIEGLKGWLERSGGVDWKEFSDPAYCVLAAQVRRMASSTNPDTTIRIRVDLSAEGKQSLMNELGERIRALPGAGR